MYVGFMSQSRVTEVYMIVYNSRHQIIAFRIYYFSTRLGGNCFFCQHFSYDFILNHYRTVKNLAFIHNPCILYPCTFHTVFFCGYLRNQLPSFN